MKIFNLLFVLIIIVQNQLHAQSFIPNGSESSNGEFGWMTIMDGDYAFVANPGYRNTIAPRITFYGAVYIYKKDNSGKWIKSQQLVADDDRISNNSFGNAIKVNGDYLIVGAPPVASQGIGGNDRDNGDVYVFKLNRTNGLWVKEAKFSRGLKNSMVEFGYAQIVGITGDGDTVLIGGDELKVFTKSSTGVWTQQPSFPINGSITFNELGMMFLLGREAVHVYQYNSVTNSFSKIQEISTNGQGYDKLVAKGSEIVLVNILGGERFGDIFNQPYRHRGIAKIYKLNNQLWEESQTLTTQGKPGYGLSVGSICGDYMVAAAYDLLDSPGETPRIKGIAYVFKRNTLGLWEQIQRIDPGFKYSADSYIPQISCEDGHLSISDIRTRGGNNTGKVAFYKLDDGFEKCLSNKVIGQKTLLEAECFDMQQGARIIDIAEDQGSKRAIGYLQADDFVVYNIDVTQEGVYEVDFRFANVFSDGEITVLSNNKEIKKFDVPATGGWETWQNVKTSLVLDSGVQDLKLVFSGAPYVGNINTITFTKLEASTKNRIQGEDFISQQGVQIVSTEGKGEGDAIGFLEPGDSASYTSNFSASGFYAFTFSVATAIPHGIITISSGGTDLGEVKVLDTKGWQNYETLVTSIYAPDGLDNFTLHFSNASYTGNLDWFEIQSLEKNGKKIALSNSEDLLTIFPNPVANGKMSINTNENIISTSIYTINGQEALQFSGNDNVFDVSSLSAGLYLVKINTASKTLTKKLLIK